MEIRQITLDRFRRFRHFVWHPQPGINCLIGPGDGGKTTILEAIGRATSPAPGGPASEHDYFERRTEDGFEIELVIGALPDSMLGAFHPPMCWGWQDAHRPLLTAPMPDSEAVLRLMVRGTPDLEIEHRVIGPSGEERAFGADKRQLLGLCRVGEMRGSSREFRMARGSLLQRRLGHEEIRGVAARAVRAASVDLELPKEVQEGLAELGKRLRAEGIVDDVVTLELLSPPGQSLLGLLGLAVGRAGNAIPLAFAGQGAQRLASYVLATELADTPPLLLMDEVELGLEPYRQRLLMQRLVALMGNGGQAFLTTHSPIVLAEVEIDSLQRLHRPPVISTPDDDAERVASAEEPVSPGTPMPEPAVPNAVISRLGHALKRIQLADSEALLCRLPLVCEGRTEIELLSVVLDKLLLPNHQNLAALGVRLVDGGGQPHAFGVIAALLGADFKVGVFLDDEPDNSGRRAKLDTDAVVARGFFASGTCTEVALATKLDERWLDELLDIADPAVPRPGDGRRQQITEALEAKGALTPTELAGSHGWDAVREAVGICAHRNGWFKQRDNAKALAHWLMEGRLPDEIVDDITRLWSGLQTLLDIKDEPVDAPSVG